MPLVEDFLPHFRISNTNNRQINDKIFREISFSRGIQNRVKTGFKSIIRKVTRMAVSKIVKKLLTEKKNLAQKFYKLTSTIQRMFLSLTSLPKKMLTALLSSKECHQKLPKLKSKNSSKILSWNKRMAAFTLIREMERDL